MSETVASVDPVQAAIARAKAAAADLAALQAAAASTPPSTAVAVATSTQPPANLPLRGEPMTLADLASGLAVDGWLRVDEHGFLLGKDNTLYQGTIAAEIDLSAIQVGRAIKVNTPAGPQYFKTYNGVTEARGGSWEAAVAQAQRIDPKAQDYPTCDLPITILTDIVSAKGVVLVTADTVLGHSFSTTGLTSFRRLIPTIQRLFPEAATASNGFPNTNLRLTIGSEKRTNAKGTWGVLTFTDLTAA